LVAVLNLIILEFFPHFVVAMEDRDFLAPHALEAGNHLRDLNVHEEVDELEAGQQVFEAESAQHLVHAFSQERVEAHVHFLLTGEFALHLAAPDQLNHGQRHHARVEGLDLVAQGHRVQDGHCFLEVRVGLV